MSERLHIITVDMSDESRSWKVEAKDRNAFVETSIVRQDTSTGRKVIPVSNDPAIEFVEVEGNQYWFAKSK